MSILFETLRETFDILKGVRKESFLDGQKLLSQPSDGCMETT